jgi:hypothetical protein
MHKSVLLLKHEPKNRVKFKKDYFEDNVIGLLNKTDDNNIKITY